MELFILLENPPEDIDPIKEALRNFDCSLKVEGEKIVLTTSSLILGEVDIENNDVVWNIWGRVNEFIDIINGSVVVEGITMKPVVLHYIKYQDPEGQIKFLPNIGRAHIVLPVPRSSKPDISKFIPLSLKNKSVAKALRLCSRELDWVNLYRIYEVISEDIGGLKSKKLTIFKRTANNCSASGDISRHGKMNKGTPKTAMQLSDGKHLIKSELRKWISKKLKAESKST